MPKAVNDTKALFWFWETTNKYCIEDELDEEVHGWLLQDAC